MNKKTSKMCVFNNVTYWASIILAKIVIVITTINSIIINVFFNSTFNNHSFRLSFKQYLTIKSFNWLRKTFKWIIVDVIELIVFETIFYESILFTTTISNINASSIFVATNLTSFNLKIVLSNDITIYQNAFVDVKLSTITKIYLNI